MATYGIKTCPMCGEEFTLNYRTKVYCSRQCWLKRHNSPDRNREVSQRTAKQRGDTLRGTGTKSFGYIKRDGRHEHRTAAETKIGRSLQWGEVVHHIDGNPKNNDPDNLQVLPSQSAHASLHLRQRYAK